MATVTQTRAKFKAVCPICNDKIEKGSPIAAWHTYEIGGGRKRNRWAHVACCDGEKIAAGTPDEDKPAVPVSEETATLLGRLARRLEQLEAKVEEQKPQTITIKQHDRPDVKIEGLVHEAFELVLRLATARKRDGSHFNIFLPGPSGSGKSYMVKQVAQAMGLQFGFISCTAGMSESQLLGRCVPAGDNGQFEFQGTKFLDCYENGGVFLFDEMDAADSNVLLLINNAIANGQVSVPNRHDNPIAERHPDFVCVAAANTYGRGADRQYVGRAQLDESTLNRYQMGTVPVDYNEALERQLCPDSSLYERLLGYRQNVQRNRLERIVSTRVIAEAYDLKQQGFDDAFIDQQIFNGWREDEVRKAKGN